MAAGTKAFSIARLRGEKIAQDFKLAAREIGLTDAAEDGGCGPAEVSGRNRESAWVGGRVALMLFRLSFLVLREATVSAAEVCQFKRTFEESDLRRVKRAGFHGGNFESKFPSDSSAVLPPRVSGESKTSKQYEEGEKDRIQTRHSNAELHKQIVWTCYQPRKKTHMDSVFGQKSTVMCCGIK